jgi:HEAT repeat protein
VSQALVFARDADPKAAKLVLQALGAAGTPAAQEALCSLAADGAAPVAGRADALGALIQTRRPTGATITAIIHLMDAAEPSVRRQALYVGGAIGSDSHDAGPDASAQIEGALLDRYGKSRGPARLDLLVALGNLATPNVLPPIEQALADDDASVRAGAARALRKVKAPSADRLISTAMTGDRDPSVRAAAVLAASFRPIGPLVEPLAHTVEVDPVDYVRTGAIEAVASHVDESPLIQKALVTAATRDPSPGIRRLARQALGPRLAALDPNVH